MPSLNRSLQRSLATGTTVVTPNRRLARAVIDLYDRAERAAGRRAWPAARALPWEAWVGTLWEDALAAGAVTPRIRLRTPLQKAHAWNRIVAADGLPLIDPRGAAAIAADAWDLVHAWGQGGESWRSWASRDDGADDCATFSRWASRYARELRDAEGVDSAELPDRVCEWASAMPTLRGASFALAGFVEFSPQQERLVAALAAAGATIARESALQDEEGRLAIVRAATPRDEIARALAWARGRALADPEATIGIVIRDLAERRDEVRTLADEILCPTLVWPGGEGAPRPYNVSLGLALSEIPLVAAALDLLEWSERPLPLGRAAALLRSPWVAVGADAWIELAGLERTWIEEGRATISLRAATLALAAIDRSMAARWGDLLDAGQAPPRGSPREHAAAWRIRLAALGWPGDRAQDSAEYQAVAAWDRAVAEMATLGAIEIRMTRAEALAALRAHLGSVMFQPESPTVPIQIAGLLEAAGQPFDALWLAGLTADEWPPAPRPNALLPVAWQRERNVPRSSAARELAYSSALTAQFGRAAPDVVFSFAQHDAEHARTPSALLPDGAPALDDGGGAPVPLAQAHFALRAPRECVADDAAPALKPGVEVRGGAGLIEAQSDCPFKATAVLRLRADPWPAPRDGLSPLERGTLVHETLAAFWAAVRSHGELDSMPREALEVAIGRAIEAAKAALPAGRWRGVAAPVREGESARIARLVREWIDDFERPRPAFAISELEAERTLSLGGLPIRLRLDRIDALEDGGLAIIDYKTGRVDAVNGWFEPRPRSPQLGLYALAQRQSRPAEPLRAVAYAQLRPGDLGVRGLAADEHVWPDLGTPRSLRDWRIADWAGVETLWSELLTPMGAEIVAGVATVSPRDRRKTCALCGRQPLCRIGALAIEDRQSDADE